MAPPAKALKEALIQGTCDVFKLDPDTTSVNKVRRHVEEQLGLDEGFFAGDNWKQSSKEIIKEYVVSLPGRTVYRRRTEMLTLLATGQVARRLDARSANGKDNRIQGC